MPEVATEKKKKNNSTKNPVVLEGDFPEISLRTTSSCLLQLAMNRGPK